MSNELLKKTVVSIKKRNERLLNIPTLVRLERQINRVKEIEKFPKNEKLVFLLGISTVMQFLEQEDKDISLKEILPKLFPLQLATVWIWEKSNAKNNSCK